MRKHESPGLSFSRKINTGHSETNQFYEREIAMLKQEAIIFTKNNAKLITDSLIDWTDPYVLLAEYEYLFPENGNLVLVRSVMEDGQAVLSHVVRTSMFYANAKPKHMLTDTCFTEVEQL